MEIVQILHVGKFHRPDHNEMLSTLYVTEHKTLNIPIPNLD